jgi:hypothetical protein
MPVQCRQSAENAEPRYAVARVFDKAQYSQDVSDMGGVEKLQAAEFNKLDLLRKSGGFPNEQ